MLLMAGLAASTALGAGDLVSKGDAYDRQFKSEEALEAYLQAAVKRPNDADLQRKIAKQYVEMVLTAPSRREQVRLAQLGYDHALKARELAPCDPVARLSVAVSAGRLAFATGDPRRKIEMSRITRDEAQEALRLRPRYAMAWHVLGRWHYELSNLNTLLRVIAESIYGRLPEASQEEAVRHLERAVQLEPGNVMFHAELGRAYLAVGRKDEAKRELQKSLALPRRTLDDEGSQERARQALATL